MKKWAEILEEDLRWREAELVSLKRIAIVNNENDIVLRAALRACWAILYAHFEGFTKFCWDLLLDHVQSKNITIGELKDDFQLLALEKQFRQLRGDLKSITIWNFFNTILPEALHEEAIFYPECRPNTKSNLWPVVFEQECARIGIISHEMKTYKTRIKALVTRRNEIAHGKKMTIKSIDEYSEYENVTLFVLHDLAIQTLEILEKESYKKN
ncbi:MAG: MAE_28990/MAE_18760 family HEPN-like nuclease [Candidatus Omnitrophota bacterium]